MAKASVSWTWRVVGLAGAMAVAVVAGPVGTGGANGPGSRVLSVVAAEDFWGSLAAQLGGRQVQVTSIVTDPNADPHEYETSALDARELAGADLVVVNGAGYDEWADKLLSAQPAAHRTVLTVATLLGKTAGDNPHFWYDPAFVLRVVHRITADYEAIEPQERAYFAGRARTVQADLAPYRQHLAYIRAHFAGTKVASTETVFQYLAQYLQLDLVTPYAFMKSVAEGNDPPATTVATFERQIQAKAFKVLVYNNQTVTPLTGNLRAAAAAEGIPVVAVSETVQPASVSFETWMDRELAELTGALDLGRSAP
ncbi:MAG TPA: zinc ABC transporter substrate-binding protein [Acidimicrobiales bacterium]|nr:zinc ABC transporter substrate-binding protein [Acidimicrobiales bacterium]